MKKLVVSLTVILAIIFVVGCFLDKDGDYKHEKTLWMIQHDFEGMSLHPETTPASASEEIIARYTRFIADNPRSKLAPKAYILMGDVYVFESNFDKAREIFMKTIRDYRYNAEVVAEAQNAIGRSFEKEGDWKNALATYQNTLRVYPLTSTGFMTPMYLAQYYASRGTLDEASQAFEDAKAFYENIATRYPSTPLGRNALNMSARSEMERKKWEETMLAASGVRVKSIH